MKLLKFTRYAEWWEYKLVPLLSVGYATLLLNHYPLDKAAFRIVFLLSAIIIGAVYVSVINDLTDISEDAKAGKTNRMADVSTLWKSVILGICFTAGFICAYYIYPDRLGVFFYLMAWVVFSLYSLPPARLKKRGLWGVCCDAMGAHFFPAMLIATDLYYTTDTKISLLWMIAVGIWSLCYGLRGILWHQFYDRKNDIKSATTTFASRINPENFKLQEISIFVCEICAFILILYYIFNIWLFLSFLIYVLLVLIRRFYFKHQVCLIITPEDTPHQLLMNDYYLVFFPLSLLFTAALNYPYAWIILCLHMLLFPGKSILIARDVRSFVKNFKL